MLLARPLLAIFLVAAVSAVRRGATSSRSAAGPALTAIDGGISWRGKFDTGRVEVYGRDSIRVRVGKQLADEAPGSILADPQISDANKLGKSAVVCVAGEGNVTNGDIRAVVRSPTADSDSDHTCCSSTGMVTIALYRVSTGEEIISEYYPLHGRPARDLRPVSRGSSLISASVSFNAYEGERLYGLGQHQHGKLDQKGLVVDLAQYNTEVAIPFLLSSRNYGFIWNVPSRGRVELSADKTRWYAEATKQVDYMVVSGMNSFDVMERLTEATGHSPLLPDYALGYIQCKLRYASQAELLNVTREFKRRGLPLSMIVVDYLHWQHQGDWAFDNRSWPDPAAMVKEINADGVEVMVSVWPTVEVGSVNYQTMSENGMLVSTEAGGGSQGTTGITSSFHAFGSEVDSFNPQAREFLWSQLKANYVAYGIKSFWIDADEGGGDGEGDGGAPADEVYMLGSQPEVGLMYPLYQQRAIFEGLSNLSASTTAASAALPGFTLSRSAWLGSQRYGGALWSGDTESTFESLQLQLRAGLNAQMSGIAIWTTDIGGFMLGRNQIDDPYFHELLIRWFQFALTCPLFRMHGDRECDHIAHPNFVTCPNEPWSFGEAVYQQINATIHAREELRPYISAQLALTSAQGRPLMRPLFFDFATTNTTARDVASASSTSSTSNSGYAFSGLPSASVDDVWEIDDQYMFGDDLLVAPVLSYLQRNRTVYLPPGRWTDYWTGDVTVSPPPAGVWMWAQAPLDRIPMWRRQTASK